jgi:hypothetical protein
MASPSADELRDTVDEVAIRALIAAYADVVNRRAWSELDDLVAVAAPIVIDLRDRPPISIVGPAALGEFIGGAIERFAFFEFVALNVRVELRLRGSVNHARVRTYMCELRQDLDGTPSRAFGLYQDVLVRMPTGWQFERRHYQSIARGEGSLEILDPPAIDERASG